MSFVEEKDAKMFKGWKHKSLNAYYNALDPVPNTSKHGLEEGAEGIIFLTNCGSLLAIAPRFLSLNLTNR